MTRSPPRVAPAGRRAALRAIPALGLAGLLPARADGVPEPLAEGIWVFRGLPGDIGPETLGRHGNGGFVVGPAGVLVVDSGVSASEGAERLAAIRAVTERPIRGVLLSQANQEFIFGATAFQAEGIAVLMHEDAARLMVARCENCLRTLRRELGDAAMEGTRVPRADRVFATPSAAAALVDIGRPLEFVMATGASRTATPGATALLDRESATLFAGPLLDAETVPDLQDADMAAWASARRQLRALAPDRIVPGRGPVGPIDMIEEVDAYFLALEAEVDAFLKAGRPLSEIADGVELPRFRHWDRYDSTHRRNASILYLRRERELMLK
jgi:glyoxylase-like metal-dependent hydrolase (beta-lactamase superfamily II)